MNYFGSQKKFPKARFVTICVSSNLWVFGKQKRFTNTRLIKIFTNTRFDFIIILGRDESVNNFKEKVSRDLAPSVCKRWRSYFCCFYFFFTLSLESKSILCNAYGNTCFLFLSYSIFPQTIWVFGNEGYFSFFFFILTLARKHALRNTWNRFE